MQERIWTVLLGIAAGVFLLCCAGCGQIPDGSEEDGSSSHALRIQEVEMDGLVSVETYCNEYDAEVQELKTNKESRITFYNCEFLPVPQLDQVRLLLLSNRGITPQEGIEVIEEWLLQIGLEGQIDMAMEVRDASGQLELNDNDPYPYCYPGVYEHMAELDSGRGFFVNTNQCYIQLGGNGIYSMSDGKITSFLRSEGSAAHDALGITEEETVLKGEITALGERTYDLPGGEMSISEGAEVVREFFLKGTPFPCAEGIDIGISKVRVFRLNDKYGYEYQPYRIYDSIPFAQIIDQAHITGGEFENINEDQKTAYVIDDSGVTAFTGYSEAEEVTVAGEYDRMIGIKKMVDILNKELGMNLSVNVEETGLVYCPVGDPDHDRLAKVCWMFDGVNEMNNHRIRIYADVITGELYLYEYEYYLEGQEE